MAQGAAWSGWGVRFGSLRLRLLALAVLVSLPPLGVMQWEHGRATQDRLAEAATDLEQLAGNAAREKAALLGQAHTLLAAIAHLPALRADQMGQDQVGACEAALRDIQGGAPWQSSLGVYATDGTALCSTMAGGQAMAIGDRPYFRLALARREFVLSELIIGQARWEPVVMAAEPVLDADGTVRRVIVAGIDMARLGELTRPLLPGGADLMLLADASGTVLAGRPENLDMVGRSLRSSRLELALEGERRGHVQANWPDGKPRVFGFAPVAGTDAIVVFGRDEAAILAPLAALGRTVLLVSSATVLAAMLAALAAGQWLLVRPVARLGATVRRIGQGEPLAAAVDPLGGETAELARDVNAMAGRLECAQQALQAKNRELATQAAALTQARDAAEAASAAKSRFVVAVNHDLRTLLNGMFGHVQSLADDPALTWSQRQRLKLITSGGEHLLAMIREVLDLSAIEAGRVTLAPAPMRLAGLAADCAGLVRAAAETKGLAFTVELVHPLPGWVLADGQRLRQVLLNLLGNATKFTACGGVTLRIGAGRGAPAEERLERGQRASPGAADSMRLIRFEIADTGAGMTTTEREQLFQEFIRFPDAGPSEGTGLGLAISARLVTLMGGRIRCDSTPGMGSCFWFELPLPATATPANPLPDAVPLMAGAFPSSRFAGGPGLADPGATRPPQPPHGKLRLLVADDVRANREIARSLLGAAGHSVTVVENGAEAVTAALAEDWDAVLLDLHMPVLDGIGAARRIREAYGPRGRVPIVAVTASASPVEVLDCLAAGMNGHVEKPIRTRVLHDALARIALEAAALEAQEVG